MPSPEKDISLIIAAYNAGATIGCAIKSALGEPEISQIIVVDDASTDDTAATARACDDGSGRLTILQQSTNAGPAAARNRALDLCTATWAGVLDADDFLLPGRSAGLLQFAEGADLVADDLWQVSETAIDGARKSLMGPDFVTARVIGFEEFVLSNVTRRARYRGELGFIKPLMRRDFLIRNGLRYQEHMRLGEDFELYARALAMGARLILAPAQGYVSVVRENSLSGQHSETDLLYLRDADLALMTDFALSNTEKSALRRHYASVDCRLHWRLLILAIKKRDVGAALASFLRPPPVPLYLMRQLLEQVYRRGIGRLAVLVFVMGLLACPSAFAADLDRAHFVQTFADEFNSFDWYDPDPVTRTGHGTWITNFMFRPDSNDAGNRSLTNNGELELYVDKGFKGTRFTSLHLDPFSIKNGTLIITADIAPAAALPSLSGYRYISGLITTRKTFSQTYGLFEMRAKLPQGKGLWPAFWLLPTDGSWPPEIDVMEILEDKPSTLYTSVHTKQPGLGNPTATTQMVDSTQNFHTYSVDWEADQIIFYLDDREIYRTVTPNDMHTPMYMLANLAVGGKWPGNPDASTRFPARMEIDWIRAYKKSGG